MPWTYDDPPQLARHWTDAEIRRCVDAANAAIAADPDDEEGAIMACIAAAGRQAAQRGRRMEHAYKAAPAFTMGIDGRSVTGMFAVHGNVDEIGDRTFPGLFGDGMVDGRRRAVFLWQHDASQPPIATIDRVFEVGAADLPPAVKVYAPDATGGVAVQRTYLETPRGSEVLAGLAAGAISEMSYAYDPVRWDMEEAEGGRVVRNLYRADLFDISDVLWGMNPATSADGRKGQPLHIEHTTALAAVQSYIDRLTGLAALRAKEGRVLSGENRLRIEGAIVALDEATDALKGLLAATEPKTTGRAQTRELLLTWQRLRAVELALRE